jgi:F-type H+-transporting ATPase subunit b
MPLTAVLSGGSVVDLDATVFIQFLVFLAIFFMLRALLFKPLIEVLKARERATEGDVKEARARQVQAEEKMKKYERELEKIREKASVEREKIRESGRSREREILDKARQEANATIAEGRGEIQRQGDGVRRQMAQEIQTLSQAIVATILGRKAA